MLSRRTVLAIAELATACFEYVTFPNAGPSPHLHVRTDWFADLLFEMDHDLAVVNAARTLQPQADAIKTFIMGLQVGRASEPASVPAAQLGRGLAPLDSSAPADALLEKLAADLLEYAHRSRDRTLVHIDRRRIADLVRSLEIDGLRWQSGKLLPTEGRARDTDGTLANMAPARGRGIAIDPPNIAASAQEGRRGPRDEEERPRARFGIVAALPYEFAAVKSMMDRPAEWTKAGRGAGRRYVVGEIPSRHGGSHNVAAVLLPDVGNNQASARATLLLEHFPEIEYVVMCGIAGGIPRPGEAEHDVRLGDIVVSDRGGVVQYDFGKQDGKRWSSRSAPRAPAAALIEAVRYLKAEEHAGERPWEAYLDRSSSIENAQRPGDNDSAKGVALVYPPDSLRRAGRPRVFLAAIASSGTLLKNESTRDQLAREHGVKAIEMEGSGIADAAWVHGDGYLVVRGIVDYCDREKGDHWHHHSAVAAAAYLRALIESMAAAS